MKPLSVYVHIPFCVQKCSYCDFLSFSCTDRYKDYYVEKLLNEIKEKALQLKGYEVKTVFMGGGTPTVLRVEQLADIINTICSEFNCDKNLETTIEVNPGTVNAQDFSYLRSYTNRISFGLQSDNDRLLNAIGRIHDKCTFNKSFTYAKAAGFNNINTDIIFSLPGQTLSMWETTLDYITNIKPAHVSCYGLILEKNTRLYDEVLRGIHVMPDDETYVNMYNLAKVKLKNAGYKHYEISNFAQSGYECRHNIVYWRCMEYVGIGLGASSYINSVRFRNESELGKYLTYGGVLRFDEEKIGFNDAVSEFMFLGLRMIEGISLTEFEQKFGISIQSVYGEMLLGLEKENLIKRCNGRICLTDKGILVSNYVFSMLML